MVHSANRQIIPERSGFRRGAGAIAETANGPASALELGRQNWPQGLGFDFSRQLPGRYRGECRAFLADTSASRLFAQSRAGTPILHFVVPDHPHIVRLTDDQLRIWYSPGRE
jgi:hypothetical protein